MQRLIRLMWLIPLILDMGYGDMANSADVANSTEVANSERRRQQVVQAAGSSYARMPYAYVMVIYVWM